MNSTTWQVSYETGDGWLVSRSGVVVLLAADVDLSVALACYERLASESPLEEVLAQFLDRGLYAAPQFAVLRWGEQDEAPRLVLHGGLRATVSSDGSSQVIEEARGVADRDLVGAEVVRISSAVTTDRSDGLPLVDGIARAGGVNISATAGEGGGDPGLEESAPVGIANPTDADEVTADGGTAEEVEEDVFDEVAEDVDDVAEDVTDDEVTADEVIADEVIPVLTTLPAEEDREPSLTSEIEDIALMTSAVTVGDPSPALPPAIEVDSFSWDLDWPDVDDRSPSTEATDPAPLVEQAPIIDPAPPFEPDVWGLSGDSETTTDPEPHRDVINVVPVNSGSVGSLGDDPGVGEVDPYGLTTIASFDDGAVPRPSVDDLDVTVARFGMSDSAAPAAPKVMASRCPRGHLTLAFQAHCRVCGDVVPPQEAVEVPRPVLGRLNSSTGQSVDLDREIYVGRAPRVPADFHGETPHLMPVIDPTNEVSSQHLQVSLDHWMVSVTDIGSTNGTEVLHLDGQRVALTPGVPVAIDPGCTVILAKTVSLLYEATS